MASFETAYKVVRDHEGGYAFDRDDPGGETYRGIARNHFPTWKGWEVIDRIKILNPMLANLDKVLESQADLQSLVLEFYKKEFWDVLSLDDVTQQPIGDELFDTSVNMGIGIGAYFLQEALNLNNNCGRDYPDLIMDSKIGPITLNVLNNHKRPHEVLKTLNLLQGARYIEIIKRNPRMEKFYRSWLSRVSLN